jgi:hypothetical protein
MLHIFQFFYYYLQIYFERTVYTKLQDLQLVLRDCLLMFWMEMNEVIC